LKRSPALAALSRDHHHALDAARRLRRAAAGDLDAAIDHLRAFWERRGRAHFEIEERVILPALPDTDGEWREATARVLDEHARIRSAAAALIAHDGAAGVESAHELGQLLHDHVRFEERQLFGLLETGLHDDDLARLGEAVDRAHEQTARPLTQQMRM
jgi:hemerythrin-like domain-containing protein